MKRHTLFIFILGAILAMATVSGRAKSDRLVTTSEINLQKSWIKSHVTGRKGLIPFSFVYGNQSATALLAKMNCKTVSRNLGNRTKEQITTWTGAEGLRITLKVLLYQDYPALEWTLYLKNEGSAKTSVISDLHAIDTRFVSATGQPYVLHTNEGDYCAATSYRPIDLNMEPNRQKTFSPDMGKSCNGGRGWPYYNLQSADNGIIMAIGWPGQWESRFSADTDNTLQVTAGQQQFHAALNPGEEVRTPMICLLFWQGMDRTESQNLWRRFYLAHVIPHFNGRPEQPALQIQVTPGEKDTAYVQQFLNIGIKPRLCWRDANWYTTPSGDWLQTGSWQIDPKQYPNGFRTFTNWIHRRGMEFVLWFEPERVGYVDCWLRRTHPEWILPFPGDAGDILNIGNKACLKWLTNHVDSIITLQGVDWYREDMNGSGPLTAWRTGESADRQGITENLYIQAHLNYWDELKRRHPNLHIDACASGGRRNDLETMHRAVPLLRSDYQWPDQGEQLARGNQCHTWALSAWFPFQGTGSYLYDSYGARSFYIPSFGMGGLSAENKFGQQRAYSECGRITNFMLMGDFYPLLPYSLDKEHWTAWQFNRSEHGDGCIQAFRRDSCEQTTVYLKLRGLQAKSKYEFTNFDREGTQIFSGEQLMTQGLPLTIDNAPGSAILTYKPIKTAP